MKIKKMVAARLVKAIKHLPYSLSRERTVLGLKREGFPWRIHSAPEQQVGAPPHPRKGLTKMCPWRWETEATMPRSPTNVRSVPSPSGISLGSNCIREDTMRGPWFAPVWQRLLPGLGPPCASADSRAKRSFSGATSAPGPSATEPAAGSEEDPRGEKPYVCAQGERRDHQSCTYHRPLRLHQRTAHTWGLHTRSFLHVMCVYFEENPNETTVMSPSYFQH